MQLEKAKTIAIIILCISVSYGVLVFGNSFEQISDNKISFQGKAEVIIPEEQFVKITFTFSEIDQDLIKAKAVIAEKTNKIYDELANLNILKEDIKTIDFSVKPDRTYNEDTNKYKLHGYRISHTTEVLIKDFTISEEVLSLIVDNKPENVSDLVTETNPDVEKSATQEARALAVKDAESYAKHFVKNTGIRLGKITSIYFNGGVRPYYARSVLSDSALSSASINIPISQGKNKIEANVTVTYKLR